MNILFDTHCHLYLDDFAQDLDSVIQRAFDQGIQYILIPGLDLQTSQHSIEISEKYQNIYSAVGVHPNTVGNWDSKTSKEIEHLAHHPKVIAIGEIGLDFFRNEVTLEEQVRRFKAQIQIAMDLQKPILIHNRDATELLLRILSETCNSERIQPPLKGVFHAYSGQPEILSFAKENQFLVGIGGNITFPKSVQLREIAIQMLTITVLETDSPVLAPIPFRGKRNEPSYLPIICKKLAEFTNLSENQISQQTTQTAKSFLGIK